MKKILLLGMLLAGAIVFAGKYEDEMTERMKVVEEKVQPDLTAADLQAGVNTIAGSARSMGLKVED